VSRIPLRETLAALHAESILEYQPNIGYSVVRLSHHDLAQIYAMRDALEALLLGSIASVPSESLARMQRQTDEMKIASDEADVPMFVSRNRDFHFELFGLSDDKLVLAQVERLWNQAALYQLVANYDAKHRAQVIKEHRRIVRLAKRGAMDELVIAAAVHRQAIGELDRTLVRL
jgi:DNA-binding GntR family transcriptional regulator